MAAFEPDPDAERARRLSTGAKGEGVGRRERADATSLRKGRSSEVAVTARAPQAPRGGLPRWCVTGIAV